MPVRPAERRLRSASDPPTEREILAAELAVLPLVADDLRARAAVLPVQSSIRAHLLRAAAAYRLASDSGGVSILGVAPDSPGAA